MRKLTTLLIALALISTPLLAEDVQIEHNGITLNANLETTDSYPDGPVALITHGTLFHHKSELMVALQDLLLDRGISTLAINLGLNINDRGPAPYDCNTPHTHQHEDAIDEIDVWSKWLAKNGVKKISVIGHSRGGNQTAWFAAERDSDLINKVVLIAPMSASDDKDAADFKKAYNKDLQPVLDKAMALVNAGKADTQMSPVDFIYCKQTSAAAESFVSYYAPEPRRDTATVLKGANKPVLVVIGTDDKLVIGLEDKLSGLIDEGKVTLEVIDGSDHFFRDLYAEDLADMTAEFIGNN